jgi:hypothetical protein
LPYHNGGCLSERLHSFLPKISHCDSEGVTATPEADSMGL